MELGMLVQPAGVMFAGQMVQCRPMSMTSVTAFQEPSMNYWKPCARRVPALATSPSWQFQSWVGRWRVGEPMAALLLDTPPIRSPEPLPSERLNWLRGAGSMVFWLTLRWLWRNCCKACGSIGKINVNLPQAKMNLGTSVTLILGLWFMEMIQMTLSTPSRGPANQHFQSQRRRKWRKSFPKLCLS